MFISMLSTTTINAGDRVTFTEELDSAVYGAIRDRISLIKGYIIGTSEYFSINPEGYVATTPESNA